MEIENILRRVHELEIEIQKLKTQLAKNPRRQVQVVVKKSVGFVLTYWTLLSFLVAILIALYIKYSFDVDYFESYRSVAASRKISEFHDKLGQSLLLRQEWSAAEDSFTKALAANPNNAAASYGLVKSLIFKPPPGEKFTSPETQDTMLAFLRSERPDDPDLDLLQAWRYWAQSQAAEAKKFAEAAIAKKPGFPAALLLLSHMSMAEGNLDAGIAWCEKALASQPDDANSLSNYGFMLLLKGDFKGAIVKLDRAYMASPGLLTPLVISDVHRLTGNYATALIYSHNAMQMVVNPNLRDTRFMGGEWLYNHLPESKDDHESWKSAIYATGLDRKEAIAQFAFALDSALTGDTAAADKAWARALELAPEPDVQPYFANKIKATLAFAQPPEDNTGRPWLVEKLASLKLPPAQ